jgi:hypothetical protein
MPAIMVRASRPSTAWCLRETTNRSPTSPKIAPDAPAANWVRSTRMVSTPPPAAHSR